MKHLLKIKPRTKKPKPVAIQSFKVSYLDKRSKTYHRIVLTSFASLFGFAGLYFVFGASASTYGTGSTANSAQLWFALVGLAFLATFVASYYVVYRKK